MKQPSEGKVPANTIDTATAAKLIQVTPRYVRQLSTQGWFKQVARDRWSLIEVVQGYIACLKDEGRRTSKSAADSRVRDARAAEIERRLARDDRTAIDMGEAVAALDKVTGDFLQSIGGLPARITREPRERQRIEAICDAERLRLSDRFSESAQALRSGLPADQADDEDDA
ncbi:hypothetical protein NKI61_19930 [Mesorhizobium sp. M0514]|uniref:hypothetical protein n=1 Tax=Mesorhizobium sp. M0514 TaxID=2956955 RepID=UPI0033362A66